MQVSLQWRGHGPVGRGSYVLQYNKDKKKVQSTTHLF